MARGNICINACGVMYTQAAAKRVIDFIERYNQNFIFVMIKFLNTKVLFSRQGYDRVDGNFERVQHDGLTYLVSSEGFIDRTTLLPIQFCGKIDAARPKNKGLNTPVSILIPVYGSPYYTKLIHDQILKVAGELEELNAKVYISIDHHGNHLDQLHREALEGLNANYVEIFSQEKNLGFIRNSNFLFAMTGATDIVVLWTTDVEICPYTLSRLITPLVELNDVALASPFAIGGANLEAPDTDILFWSDLDTLLAGSSPTYPDAETTVGYLLAIDRRKYVSELFFDTYFENGYGDDSDLYYRCVNLGLRGVLVDNVCVFHEHGASFSLTENRENLQKDNYSKFLDRWGCVYQQRVREKETILNSLKERITLFASELAPELNRTDILFVLPTNDRRIGGVKAVFDICDGLCKLGTMARVVTFNSPADEKGAPIKSVRYDDTRRLGLLASSSKMIVATSHDTVNPVKSLAKKFGIKSAYFVQGPEYSFSNGKFLLSVVQNYRGFDELWTVSDYLMAVVEQWVDQPVYIIPYGPPAAQYYDMKLQRLSKSIAVQFNGRMEKGADYLAAAIATLKKAGYQFFSFGGDLKNWGQENFCKHLGFLTYGQKINLFNKVEFYIDASHFEGLGLLLIESSRCGTVPVFRNNGGSAALLKQSSGGIEIGDYGYIRNIPSQLEEFRNNNNWETARAACIEALSKHTLENAVTAVWERFNALH